MNALTHRPSKMTEHLGDHTGVGGHLAPQLPGIPRCSTIRRTPTTTIGPTRLAWSNELSELSAVSLPGAPRFDHREPLRSRPNDLARLLTIRAGSADGLPFWLPTPALSNRWSSTSLARVCQFSWADSETGRLRTLSLLNSSSENWADVSSDQAWSTLLGTPSRRACDVEGAA
jgi:hypothetical protein